MLFGLLVFGAILAVVFAFVGTYNRLVAAAEKATRAWNDLDALLRQRHDEIPKLIEMCEQHFGSERVRSIACSKLAMAVFAARQTRDADALGRAEVQLRAAATALMARAAASAVLDSSPAFGLRANGRQRSTSRSRIGATAITTPCASTTLRSGAFRAASWPSSGPFRRCARSISSTRAANRQGPPSDAGRFTLSTEPSARCTSMRMPARGVLRCGW